MSTALHGGDAWIEYDYAIVRLVPRVHCDVFMNIGVVVHARAANYLDACFTIADERVARFAPALDRALLRRYADAFRLVCAGGPAGGPIGLLPPSERFHWLTAPRSAVMQVSPVHPGRCRHLEDSLAHLLMEHCGS
ncbi:MAG TPA: DUF3037 domain-containing protein [Candidatus Kapabacteria bacterium]|nr:DUF3037 domain-containing protein [Candidatus Kapabacteria bacterium]